MRGIMSDAPLSLTHVFGRAERLFGAKQIVTATADGRERTTYADWAARTRLLGGAFETLGLASDARVGTFAWNTARHLELYYAAPCSGRVCHTLNIRLFPEQVTYAVNHAEDEIIFVDRSLLPIFLPLVPTFESVKHLVVMDDGADHEVPADDSRWLDYEELLAGAQPAEFHAHDEHRAAGMCYTSGTTGHPKGVVYSHRSQVLHGLMCMTADTLAISERDTVLPIVPMFHANAWGLGHSAVMAGANYVMPGPDLSAPAIADLMESERVTVAAGVPTIWQGVAAELDGRDLSALRTIACGGSAVPKSLSETYREKVGISIHQAWGMTETSPIASVATMKSTLGEQHDPALADMRASAGLSVPLVDLRIVDPDDGTEQPWDGEARGELQASGPWIAAGYYNDERSGDSFTLDGWLKTGDIATIDPEGYVRLVDRTKDLIKSGGEWISSVELENEIMAHPQVREAAVIGVPDERWGERPLACVVAVSDGAVTPDDIRDHLDGLIPKWWMPERIEMIDEVPKTSVGKFSKKDLRTRFGAAAPWQDGSA
jgi:fatty-acyl-CoA synthase